MRAADVLPAAWRALSSPMRVLPDFVVIGTQKGGTSSLYEYLIRHPRITSAFVKEVHYFSGSMGRKGDLPGRIADRLGARTGLVYRAHFPSVVYRRYSDRRGGRILTGEATPYYLFHPAVPARMRKLLPEAKLIVLLRDPVSRAYSHYHHEKRLGREKLTFEEAVEREEPRLAADEKKIFAHPPRYSFPHHHYSYLARGLYFQQIARWREHFPESRFLVLKSEDFFTDPASALERVQNFLGLPVVPGGEYGRYNEGNYPPMSKSMREWLDDYYGSHNERLYEYLGTDFGWGRGRRG